MFDDLLQRKPQQFLYNKVKLTENWSWIYTDQLPSICMQLSEDCISCPQCQHGFFQRTGYSQRRRHTWKKYSGGVTVVYGKNEAWWTSTSEQVSEQQQCLRDTAVHDASVLLFSV